jgi:cytochrome c-type biogenesis protein CcmF
MTRLLGQQGILLALATACYGIATAVIGVRKQRRDLVESAFSAVYATFGLLTLATAAMIYGLVTHDFSIGYVAQVGSTKTPTFYTVISLWGALEGSILFWGWVLAMYSAVVVWQNRARPGQLVPYAAAVLLAIGAFFYILMLGPANPFTLVSPVPADGPGPNPLLQNHILMAVHPPLLYLGYVGMAVPARIGSSSRDGGRFRRGRFSRWRSSPGCGGRTKCWGGAATGRGIPSRTRRSCRG